MPVAMAPGHGSLFLSDIYVSRLNFRFHFKPFQRTAQVRRKAQTKISKFRSRLVYYALIFKLLKISIFFGNIFIVLKQLFTEVEVNIHHSHQH